MAVAGLRNCDFKFEISDLKCELSGERAQQEESRFRLLPGMCLFLTIGPVG